MRFCLSSCFPLSDDPFNFAFLGLFQSCVNILLFLIKTCYERFQRSWAFVRSVHWCALLVPVPAEIPVPRTRP